MDWAAHLRELEGMAFQIQILTASTLRVTAAAAAEQHIPLSECNHYEKGSELWHQFNAAYRAREAVIHAARRDAEKGEVATC